MNQNITWHPVFGRALAAISKWRSGAHLVYGGARINQARKEILEETIAELKRQGVQENRWEMKELDRRISGYILAAQGLSDQEKEETRNLVEMNVCLNKLEKILKGEL